MDEVVLTQVAEIERNKVNLEDKDTITAFLRKEVSYRALWLARANKQVEGLIETARSKWQDLHQDDDIEQEMMLPLIRLKVGCLRKSCTSQLTVQVETSEAKEMTNPVRFGQDFIGRVANPRDILQYYRKKKQAERSLSTFGSSRYKLTGRNEKQSRCP